MLDRLLLFFQAFRYLRLPHLHGLFTREEGGAVPRVISVGTTSGVVLRANSKRKRAFLQNISDTAIYLMKADTAFVAAGILLEPGIGWVEEVDALGYIYTGPFSAVSSVASKPLSVIEE